MRGAAATIRSIARAAVLLAGAGPALAAPAGPIAKTESGTVGGTESDGIISFKGIPFAAPPIGPLRWRAPQPVTPWKNVLDATAYAADCMQKPFPGDAAPLGTTPSEDCLYLNVWKPAVATAKLPVMVWIYGGGFVNGGSSPPTYSGAELARQGIMVVSFNYRLGRFGYFAHPALTRADADNGLLVDYGYMDQLAALRWVRRNIAAFGGDPVNVTIVGESAGGMSVHALITSPLASGLFSRAVIESGGPRGLPADSMAEAEKIGVAFAASKGIADDDRALARLRSLPRLTVVDDLNLATLMPRPGAPRTFVPPIADGKLSRDPLTAYAAGTFNRVPVMVGATSDDLGGPDGVMLKGAEQTADALSAQGVPVWYYRFSYVADSVRTPQTRGAAHASDIPFFFHTEGIRYGAATTSRDRGLGRIASAYLVNFVKTGDPNGAGLTPWRRYDSTRPMLDLAADGAAKPRASSAN